MPAYIRHIETGVPDPVYAQRDACATVQSWTTSARERRILHHLYQQSGIETRHSVCADFLDPAQATLFVPEASGQPANPGTQARNNVFARESRRLAETVGARALAACPELRPHDITHLVTVSCTGFSNPGFDFHLIQTLGLNPGTQRFHLGFMGCYAAFPALRMAQQFCEADARAVVLVMCLELCSLHLQVRGGPETWVANALFADGAACAVVHGRAAWAPASCYRLDHFASGLVPRGEKDMAWSIGDHGFNIVLSSYVPDLLAAELAGLVDPLLASLDMDRHTVEDWAVHPGGKAILDQVAAGLALPAEALAVSRAVLARYGNMSSATLLFVLDEMRRRRGAGPPRRVCAMAFGPGLTIELGVWQALSAPVAAATARVEA